MPREIEKCPECGSIEQLVDYKIDLNYKWCEYCEERFMEEKCSEIIYTQSEVNEIIFKHDKAYSNLDEELIQVRSELNETVKQEREECAKSIDSYIVVQRKIHDKMDLPEYDASFEACMTVLSQRAEALRQRGLK